jgi:hypothetical protein
VGVLVWVGVLVTVAVAVEVGVAVGVAVAVPVAVAVAVAVGVSVGPAPVKAKLINDPLWSISMEVAAVLLIKGLLKKFTISR